MVDQSPTTNTLLAQMITGGGIFQFEGRQTALDIAGDIWLAANNNLDQLCARSLSLRPVYKPLLEFELLALFVCWLIRDNCHFNFNRELLFLARSLSNET